MSQDFYSSGFNMGEEKQWSGQQGWPSPQQTPLQYNQEVTPPAPPAQNHNNSNQYDSSQYDASQYSQQQQYDAQQSFYTTPPQQQEFYDNPQTTQNYNNNQSPTTDNQFFNGAGTGSLYNPNSNMGTMGPAAPPHSTSDGFEDEPPLMEELGIDLHQIYQTTMTVLNPSKPAATTLMDDPDLSGPLMFCLGFGSLLLLSGKIHFGYIYGVALIGALAMYALLNLMSVSGVSVSVTVSVLGYCMLPMCVLAGVAALLSLQGAFGVALCSLTVSWAAFASSKLFVSVLAMYDQQPLVAYPCAIMYGIFAVLTVF